MQPANHGAQTNIINNNKIGKGREANSSYTTDNKSTKKHVLSPQDK
jgi:hypothetical protein